MSAAEEVASAWQEQLDEWKARALAAEANQRETNARAENAYSQAATSTAECDEARAEVERLREALSRAVVVLDNLGYKASVPEARAALSPSPPDTEEQT